MTEAKYNHLVSVLEKKNIIPSGALAWEKPCLQKDWPIRSWEKKDLKARWSLYSSPRIIPA